MRKTRLFRTNSPSNNQRNKILRDATRYASIVDTAMITLVKALGSELKEGEFTLTIPDAAKSAAKNYERLNISDGPNGELVCKVTVDPDVAEQIAALKAEYSASSEEKVL